MTENTSRPRQQLFVPGQTGLFWIGYLCILWLTSQLKAMVPEQWGELTWGLTSSVLLLFLTFLFLRLEGRTMGDVGLNLRLMSIPRVVMGTLIGLGIFGIVILLIALVAGVHFERNASLLPGPFLGVVATTLALSSMEELGFRGYPLRTLVNNLGLWKAQAIVAVAFGLTHILYGWPWTSVLFGVVPSALLFGISATASRGLAMPIGVHAGVNLAQSFVSEENAAGIWTLVVDETAQSRVAMMSPVISVSVVLLATVAFWYWGRTVQGADGE